MPHSPLASPPAAVPPPPGPPSSIAASASPRPRLPRLPQAVRLTLQFFSNHGIVEGLRLLALRALAPGRVPSPLPLATPLDLYPRQTPLAVHPFDLAHSVETSGFQHGAELGLEPAPADIATPPDIASTSTPACLHPSPTAPTFAATVWNTAYYGIAPSVFERALALVGTPTPPGTLAAPSTLTPPDWSRFSFVDLGCGKGRALLLASRHPFLQILGVELDSNLARTARANLRAFHAPWQQCRTLAVHHADATAFDLPATPSCSTSTIPFSRQSSSASSAGWSAPSTSSPVSFGSSISTRRPRASSAASPFSTKPPAPPSPSPPKMPCRIASAPPAKRSPSSTSSHPPDGITPRTTRKCHTPAHPALLPSRGRTPGS